MATKASCTLVLIIEKKHAPWRDMVSASPSLELWLWCHLRIAPIYSEHCDGCASDNDKVHKRASHGHQRCGTAVLRKNSGGTMRSVPVYQLRKKRVHAYTAWHYTVGGECPPTTPPRTRTPPARTR